MSWRFPLPWYTTLVVGLIATSARAQDADVAHLTWDQLVQRAQEASSRGDHREALAWTQKAGAIRLSPSLRVFILGEQRALGDAASAYANAKMCVADAEADPKLANRDSILTACRDAAAALAPAIGQLALTLPAPLPPGIAITINAAAVLPAILALPYPMNPGNAVIEVRAPGFAPFRQEVAVRAGSVVNVPVALQTEEVKCPVGQVKGPDQKTCVPLCTGGKTNAPDLVHCCWPGQGWSIEQNACSGTPQCPPGLIAAENECTVKKEVPPFSSSPPPPRPEPPVSRNSIPLFVAGAGALIAIGGTVAWFVADSKFGTLKTDCGSPVRCSMARYASDSPGVRTFDALSVLGWTTGGAALLGGGLWYLLSTPQSSPSVGIRWQVNPMMRSANVVGTFQ